MPSYFGVNMDVLMKLCDDVFDTYISNLTKERFRIIGSVFEALCLHWESGPTSLIIIELDSELSRTLGITAPAMCILISDSEDEMILQALQIPSGYQQTQNLDHLYIFSTSSLMLLIGKHRLSEEIYDIDLTPQANVLPGDAVEKLTQLVRHGRFI